MAVVDSVADDGIIAAAADGVLDHGVWVEGRIAEHSTGGVERHRDVLLKSTDGRVVTGLEVDVLVLPKARDVGRIVASGVELVDDLVERPYRFRRHVEFLRFAGHSISTRAKSGTEPV